MDQTTVIVGSNNSGKSNFLEIFKFLSDLHFGGQDGKDRVKRYFNGLNQIEVRLVGHVKKAESIFEVTYRLIISVTVENKSNRGNLVITSESFDYKQKSSPGKPKQFFNRTDKSFFLRAPSDKLRKYDISAEDPAYVVIKSAVDPTIGPESLNCVALYLDFLEYFRTPTFSAHKLNGAYDKEIDDALKFIFPLQEGNAQSFNKFKRAYIEILGLSDIRIHDAAKHLKDTEEQFLFCIVTEQHQRRHTLISNLSDGSKILFLMLYNIFISNPPLVCIEEPEIGLHPSALNKILRIFLTGETGSQAIITTHSAYLLNLLDPKNIFLMESAETGLSTLIPALTIKNLEARLKGKYVNFGDLFAGNFKSQKDDYTLSE